MQSSLFSPVLTAVLCWEHQPHLGLLLGSLAQQQHPSPCTAVVGTSLWIALLTVAGEDVAVGGSEPHAPGTSQPHGLQLGGLGPAAVAGRAERLLQDCAERNHGLRARCLAAAPFTASQQHHLRKKRDGLGNMSPRLPARSQHWQVGTSFQSGWSSFTYCISPPHQGHPALRSALPLSCAWDTREGNAGRRKRESPPGVLGTDTDKAHGFLKADLGLEMITASAAFQARWLWLWLADPRFVVAKPLNHRPDWYFSWMFSNVLSVYARSAELVLSPCLRCLDILIYKIEI